MEPLQIIESLDTTAAAVRQAVEGQSSGILHSKPAPGKWSALEVICHLVDTEKLIFQKRIKTLLQETDPYFPDIDHLPWVRAHGYSHQDLQLKLEQFLAEREQTVRTLERLKPEQWELPGTHQIRGRITLAQVAMYCATHTMQHVEQIRRTISEIVNE